MNTLEDDHYLKSKLQWLMFFRVLVATFFFGIATVTQLRRSESFVTPNLIYLYVLTGSAFALTFIYASVLPFVRRLALFAYIQIIADMIFITALLFITGGINSIFSFLYSISIISASICLFMPGGIFAATAASILYSGLIWLQELQVIAPLHIGAFTATGYEQEHLLFPIIINIPAFYIVAVLSSFLTQQAKKTRQQLQKKQLDLEQLEALNEKIIQNIPSGLLTLNTLRQIVTFNRAAEEITGYAFSQVYLKHIEEIFPNIITAGAGYRQSPSGLSAASGFETSFIRKDDQELLLGFSESSIKNPENEEIGSILIFQDLTTFKNMQEHLKRIDRLAAVGRLAAGLAHEVRNPLASISGSIQVLHKSLKLANSDSHLMDIIVKESNNLSLLISDFTQYARAEAQNKEEILLKTIADEVVDLFRNSSECLPVLAIHQLIAEHLVVIANRQQIKQIFWNLILNSAQAMTEKPGTITLTACMVQKKPEPIAPLLSKTAANAGEVSWVEIKFTDDGCGIKQSELGCIFDPFFTTKDSGIGLGLAIVYKIIQEHNGFISVESSEGSGATFTCLLPAPLKPEVTG
jgi:two-component system sensor histidine kinase PilS (NtrC family)